jgi:hypothetical protein
MITFAAPATPSFDQQLSAMSIDLNAVRQSIDRIAAGQEKLTRSIDQITPGIATGQEEMTHSSDQSAPGIATGQEQMTRSSDQSATGIGQAPRRGRVASRSRAEPTGHRCSRRYVSASSRPKRDRDSHYRKQASSCPRRTGMMLPASRQLRLWHRTTREDGPSGRSERPVTRAPYVGTPPRDPGEATTGPGLLTIGVR